MVERTASFYIEEDQWHCTTHPLSEIGKIEPDASFLLCHAYNTWRNLQGNGLPLLNLFNAKNFFRNGETGRLSRIDTSAELQDYEINWIGPGELRTRQLDPGNPFHRHGILMEILECKETRQPMFQEIHTIIGGKETHKLRLFLPFADRMGNVTAIIAACCLLPITARRITNLDTVFR